MNSLHLSGTILEAPVSSEHNKILAARVTVTFAAESTVTVVAVGAVAQELCSYKAGDGIIVTGRLAGKLGKLEILAEKVAPHRGGIYERHNKEHKRAELSERYNPEIKDLRRLKTVKRHW
jgi:hypothetical protein